MNYILPGLILLLLATGLVKRVNIYEAFISGAADALPLLLKILPYMAAMMAALRVFRASGALEAILSAISPAFELFGMPGELVPLFALRPFSGNAALALLQDVFDTYGVDSYLGFAASLMLGSTETIFYTVALYFGSVGVSRTRVSVPAALISGVVGAAAAIIFANILFV